MSAHLGIFRIGGSFELIRRNPPPRSLPSFQRVPPHVKSAKGSLQSSGDRRDITDPVFGDSV